MNRNAATPLSPRGASSFVASVVLLFGCGPTPPEEEARDAWVFTADAAADGGSSSASGCSATGGREGLCGDDEYRYTDAYCYGPPSPDSGSPPTCFTVGDELCYRRCASDADCTDPCAPRCMDIGLSLGSHAGCAAHVRVCRSAPPASTCD